MHTFTRIHDTDTLYFNILYVVDCSHRIFTNLNRFIHNVHIQTVFHADIMHIIRNEETKVSRKNILPLLYCNELFKFYLRPIASIKLT